MTMTTETSRRPVRLTQRAVQLAEQTLATVQARRRSRLLGLGDLDDAVSLYRSGRAIARRLGVDLDGVYVAAHGGRVCHSYGCGAETTRLRISAHGITVSREWASSRPWGQPATIHLHVPAPDGMPGKDAPRLHGCRPVRRDGEFIY